MGVALIHSNLIDQNLNLSQNVKTEVSADVSRINEMVTMENCLDVYEKSPNQRHKKCMETQREFVQELFHRKIYNKRRP